MVNQQRLYGLDLARFLAFVGMVIVNLRIVMGADYTGAEFSGDVIRYFADGLQGRAAATFVVLAGLGLGLAAQRTDRSQTIWVTIKRAIFLLIIGLLNSLFFDADILHYYAFYFLLGVLCLSFSSRFLLTFIVLFNVVFLTLALMLDYNTGWNWETYSYTGFWTLTGFIRNLFFNGWHPVFPWTSFLIYGIWLSRLPLAEKGIQIRLIVFGLLVFIVNGLLSNQIVALVMPIDNDFASFFTTSPIPPMPLYVVAGMSFATVMVGLCLRASNWLERQGVLKIIVPAGKQTLTLYIAHIFVGMGALEYMGLISDVENSGQQSLSLSIGYSLMFCGVATVYAFYWSKFFKRGPIEFLMRKLAG